MNTIEDLRNDLDPLFLLYPFLRSLQFTVEDEEGICSTENRYRPVIPNNLPAEWTDLLCPAKESWTTTDCAFIGQSSFLSSTATITDCTFIGSLDREEEE